MPRTVNLKRKNNMIDTNNRFTKRIGLPLAAFIALVVVAALALSATSHAAEWGEIRAADRNLNVRKSRTPKSEHVITLLKGDQVKIDFPKDGWVAVFDPEAKERNESKAIGYAKSKYLLPVKADKTKAVAKQAETEPTVAPAQKTDAKVMSVAQDAKVYMDKSEQSPVMATLAKGEYIQVGFPDQGWHAVFRMNEPVKDEKKALGYVRSAALADPAPEKTDQDRFQVDRDGVESQEEAQATKIINDMAGIQAPQDTEVKAKVDSSEESIGPKPLPKEKAVKITSEKMTYNQKDNTVSFIGNVHAVHAGLTLWAKTVTAYFAKSGEKKGTGADSIERIVAKGEVKIKKDNNEGLSEVCTYTVKDGVIRMEGDPMLTDGENTVRGDVINFYLRDNRSEVIGGKGKRVEAIFFTPEGMKP